MDRSPFADAAPPPLEELIVRGRGGDRAALTALIRHYQTRMVRFVIRQTDDQTHYEDLCQAIFVKMVIALPKLREVERFESWLFQIARNICRDHLRAGQGWRRLFVPLGVEYESVVADSAPAPHVEGEDLGRGMARLPAEQRQLIELSLEKKRSHEELAAMTRTSVSSVKSRLFRARENLRGILLAGDGK
jgi:RNA polymerase sigma-70 factor (ECF subfamily)